MEDLRGGVFTRDAKEESVNGRPHYTSVEGGSLYYSTSEPHDAFHQRIDFCLKMHNDLVKSMRYPPNAYRRYLEKGGDASQDSVEKVAAEIAEEMEEEDD